MLDCHINDNNNVIFITENMNKIETKAYFSKEVRTLNTTNMNINSF